MLKDRIEYKIILIGDQSIEKTLFFKKLTTGILKEKNISTVGIDRRTITLYLDFEENKKTVEKIFDISLVDTAGEERFKCLTKYYYKESDGILMFYDVTNRYSFNEVDIWLESIFETLGKNEKSKKCIFLIGTKIDLIGIDGHYRCIEEEEAKKFCEEKNIIWGGEISIKNFTPQELREKLEEYVKKLYLKIGETKKPKEQIIKKISEKKVKKKCLIM